jgi:hypothetical protein
LLPVRASIEVVASNSILVWLRLLLVEVGSSLDILEIIDIIEGVIGDGIKEKGYKGLISRTEMLLYYNLLV